MCNREECTCDLTKYPKEEKTMSLSAWKQSIVKWKEKRRQEKIAKRLDIVNGELVKIFEKELLGKLNKTLGPIQK